MDSIRPIALTLMPVGSYISQASNKVGELLLYSRYNA